MIPARVIGRLVPARIIESLAGVPLLLVQPVDAELRDTGTPVVACDAIGANEGEFVFMAQGREATIPLPASVNPADLTIVSIIDEVTS
jgi:microcompartment protein CcmK/EutM